MHISTVRIYAQVRVGLCQYRRLYGALNVSSLFNVCVRARSSREKRRLTEGQSSVIAAACTVIIKIMKYILEVFTNNIQFRQNQEKERGKRDN